MGFDYSRSNKRWWALRERALRRDGHKCREAARYGRRAEAQVVHHIWPAEDYPEYAYCLWNLISLSTSAHDAMHDRNTRKLTAKGLAWKNRTPPPANPEK
jgi:5-methylcytosine-specific restriction endonuclease McrA